MSRPIVTKPKVISICCKLQKQILKETSDCRLVARKKQFKNRIYRLWRERDLKLPMFSKKPFLDPNIDIFRHG